MPHDLYATLRQWDAFFKEVLPDASALRAELAHCLDVAPDDLRPQHQLPSEYRSRIVAAALHHKGIYKEFRLDGLFKTKAYEALGYEYQSTFDQGIPLRILMYEIAVAEAFPEIREGGIQFVIIYSEPNASDTLAKRAHGRRVGYFTRSILLDIDQLDATKLKTSDLASLVLSLRQKVATPASFLAAIRRINDEAGTSHSGERLKKAVVAAAIGRPEVMAYLHEHAMDPQVVKSLEVLRSAAANDHSKMHLMLAIKWIPDVPDELPAIVEAWPLKDIDSLWHKIDAAKSTGDWSLFMAPTASPGL